MNVGNKVPWLHCLLFMACMCVSDAMVPHALTFQQNVCMQEIETGGRHSQGHDGQQQARHSNEQRRCVGQTGHNIRQGRKHKTAKILSANVTSLGKHTSDLRQAGCDVLLLQEPRFNPVTDRKCLEKDWGAGFTTKLVNRKS